MNNNNENKGGGFSGLIRFIIVEVIINIISTAIQMFTIGLYINIYKIYNSQVRSSILCHLLTVVTLIGIVIGLCFILSKYFDLDISNYSRRYRYFV